GRLRPGEEDGSGHFFRGSDSFFSAHASLSWSIATVLAHEYPGWLSQSLLYGGASAISLARVAAGKHFMSDVVVGSAVGYMIGRHVYYKHHDESLPGAYIPSWAPEEKPHTKSIALSYVPMESWVYPAIERLAAMGYIPSEFMGLRPWTRIECA